MEIKGPDLDLGDSLTPLSEVLKARENLLR